MSAIRTAGELVQRIQLVHGELDERLNPSIWQKAIKAIGSSLEQPSLQAIARLLIDHQNLIELEEWKNDSLNRALTGLRVKVLLLYRDRSAAVTQFLFHTFPELPQRSENDLQLVQRLIRPGYLPRFDNFYDLKNFVLNIAEQEAYFTDFKKKHGEDFGSPFLLAHLANWCYDQLFMRHFAFQNMQTPKEILALREWVCLLPNEICSTFQSIEVRQVSRIVPEFATLANLVMVNFVDCELNYLTHSLSPLADLRNLRMLSFSNCGLDDIPMDLLRSRVDYISLARNKISRLNIDKFPSTLTYLDCSQNQLTSLPSSISRLTFLNSFNVSNNLITALPDEIVGLVSLNFFSVAKNALTELPNLFGLNNLVNFNLDHNCLQSAPSSLLHLSALKRLNLANNPIKLTDVTLQVLQKRIPNLKVFE